MYLGNISGRKCSLRRVVALLMTVASILVLGLLTYSNQTNDWNWTLLPPSNNSTLTGRILTDIQNITFPKTCVNVNATFNPPGVILATKYGLGNQLFEYACSYALARQLGWPLYLYIPPELVLKSRDFGSGRRDFALDKFHVRFDNVIDSISRLSKNVTYLKDQELLEVYLKKNADIQFFQQTGYCQSIEYWRNYQDDIKAMFELKKSAIDFPKIQKIINKIERSAESVVVHVRRGDIMSHPSRLYVPLSFQRGAILRIINILSKRGKKRPVFFVFSDHITYVKGKLKDFDEKYEMVYVAQEVANLTSIEEFYLMTICDHIITPSSTYSWWATYLIKNKDKIVIASAFSGYFSNFDKELHGRLFHPNEWIVIDPFTGRLINNV